jgi:hypothetical protein
MARAARAALADARAVEEQTLRQQMHGGAFYGAGMRVGGSATPSMGLSQFRGGGGRCSRCLRTSCCCSDSDSDGEMHGGAGKGSALIRFAGVADDALEAAMLARFGRLATASERAAAASEYAALLASRQGAITRGMNALESGRGALTNVPTPTTLALRNPNTALVPYRNPGSALIPSNVPIKNPVKPPYDMALDLRGVKGTPTGVSPTLASRLSAMGVTPGRLAAALAAGVGISALAAYFGSQQPPPGGGPGGNYDVYPPPGPDTVVVPPPVVGPRIPPYVPPVEPPVDPTIDPTTGLPYGLVPGTPKKVVAAYLRSGNVPTRYLRGNQAQRMAMASAEGATGGSRTMAMRGRYGSVGSTFRSLRGGGAGDGRSARGQAIKQIMATHGMSLPQASKYLKEHGSA